MQQNLEQDMPVLPSQNICEEDPFLEPKKIGMQANQIDNEIRNSRHTRQKYSILATQEPQEKNLQRHSRYAKFIWSLSLRLGDSVLLITLSLFLYRLLSHSQVRLVSPIYNLVAWDMRLVFIVLAVVVWNVTARITQAYELLNASNLFRSPLSILFTLTVVLIFWVTLTLPFFGESTDSYIKIMLLFYILVAPILSAWRILFAEIMSMSRFRMRTVIVGTTIAGKTIANELRRAKRPHATIMGYISEHADTPSEEDGIPILGGRNALQRMGQSGMIDMIITAVDYHTYPALLEEVFEMAQLGISIVPMAIVYENVSGKIPVEHIGDQWYLALPLDRITSLLYLCWRKFIDLIFGLLGTALLISLLPILGPLIYLDSPGPIIYPQERIGFRGKPFRIYKFRSMHTNAEDVGNAVWASKHDPRVTRIGQFMRPTHLDELPQVVNILRGQMSLIGPRPEREAFIHELGKAVPFYRHRLAIKPGLTGWAQVKYRYGNTHDDALIKLQYDLYYIKHQSFTLDVFIILKTIGEVVLHRGT